MESRSRVTLLLLLCLAFSVCKARRLVPDPDADADASPQLSPDASPQLAPDASPPQLAPRASRHKPVAVSRLTPKKSLSPAASSIYGPISSPAPSPWSDKFPFDDMEGPEASAAMDDIAAKMNGPAANEAMDEAARYASEFDEKVLAPAASAAKEGAAALGPAISTAAAKLKDKAADLEPVATSAMDKVASWFKGASN